MAQIQLHGYLVYNTADYYPAERRWCWLAYDPSDFKDSDRVAVRSETITVDVPDDFDPRRLQVQALREQEQQLRAEFARRVKEINDRINSLLAIEMSGQS